MASESQKVTDLMDRARGMLTGNPLVQPQLEQFWKAQDGILEEAEAYSRAWFERRHDATKSALETVRNVNGNGGDPAAAVRAMIEWQQGSFQRLAEDMQEWVELCSQCAGHMSQAEVESGKEGVEKVAKGAKSATRTKSSTPV